MDQENQNLSQKELYDLKHQEKERQTKASHRKSSTKRILIWLVALLTIGGAIFGMVKLAGNTPSNSTGPVDAVSVTDWVTGSRNSKVILIEYGDFQCPACGFYFPIVKKLTEDYQDKLVFVSRNFPLQQHANARPAAYAAEAAGKQDKYWEIYDLLFGNQPQWSDAPNAKEIFTDYAKSLNLNLEQFTNEAGSSEVKNKVDNDYQSGIRADVNSTPTFFLNGKQIKPINYDEFRNLIEQAIKANP